MVASNFKQRLVADLHVDVPTSDNSSEKAAPLMNSDGDGLRPTASGISRLLRSEDSLLSPSSLATPGVPRLPSSSIFKPDKDTFNAQFQIQKRLGAGGFAEVFQAQQAGHTIALKLLRIDNANHAREHTIMFFKEARAMRNCDHENIVGFRGLVRVPSNALGIPSNTTQRWAILQEYMQGGSLGSLIMHQMASPTTQLYSHAQALAWCIQTAMALVHLHEQDPLIIHRDVKADNVLLTQKPNAAGGSVAKLADFGLHVCLHATRANAFLTGLVNGNALEDLFDQCAVSGAVTGVDMDKSAHSGAGVQRSTMSLTDMRKKSVRLKAGASLLDGEGLSRPGSLQSMAAYAIRPNSNLMITARPGSAVEVSGSAVHAQSFGTSPQHASSADGYVEHLSVVGLGTVSEHQPIKAVPEFSAESFAAGFIRRLSDDGNASFGQYEDLGVAFDLTGMTGSCFYMAPEVYKRAPYNEKADCFSFGVLLMEVFSRGLLAVAFSARGPVDAEKYAAQVASGWRPPLPKSMPAGIKELVKAAWAQDPAARPPMVEMVRRLQALQGEWNATGTGGAQPGCSCSIM